MKFVAAQLEARFRQTELDYDQALSNLRQTEAQILPLAIDARQAENLLCILMGMPPANLEAMLGIGPIPTAPSEVAIGIPADLFAAGRTCGRTSVWRPPRPNRSASP